MNISNEIDLPYQKNLHIKRIFASQRFCGTVRRKSNLYNNRRVYLVFRGSSIGASALIVKNGKQREEQMI
jgi:hypothetical protein